MFVLRDVNGQSHGEYLNVEVAISVASRLVACTHLPVVVYDSDGMTKVATVSYSVLYGKSVGYDGKVYICRYNGGD